MKVAIITEGFNGTGYGHLTRCLAIYQAFEEKNIIPLYIANCDENGKLFIPGINLIQFNWLENENNLLRIISGFDIAIIDSYLAPLEIYTKIYNAVNKTVYIDDFIRLDYPPGIIVNGTIGAENLPYKYDDKHKYLLGIEYMPLRKEFWDIEVPKGTRKKIKNILITLGGQDIKNLTFPIIEFINSKFPEYKIHAVVSQNIIKKNEGKYNIINTKFYSNLSAKHMLELMKKCELAISSASQTVYELHKAGVYVIAIGIADNQKNNLNGLIDKGILRKSLWYDDKNLFKKIEEEILYYIFNYNNLKNDIRIDINGARNLINFLINNGGNYEVKI
ncbi:PseG/SpsG family protein [Calditrichota bacterium GD2]